MSLPFMKLGTLVVRTLSKPIANRLKKEAAVNPKFRTSIIAMAQANHRLTTNIQRRIYGHRTDVEIRPLNEERAVQVAGDLIGELFVFTVAGAVVVFEVQRSARSEAKKEEIRKREIEIMRQRDEDLAKEVELLKQKIVEVEKLAKESALARVLNLKSSQTQAVKILKERAINRVDDIQGMLNDLKCARKEKRKIDMVLLEEQVHQMLKEWKKELNQPSPASSSSLHQGASLGSFSPDISRLLQLYAEEDDATSGLVVPKPDPDAHLASENAAFHKNFAVTPMSQEHGIKLLDQCKDSSLGINTTVAHNMAVKVNTNYDYFPFNSPCDIEENRIGGAYGMWGEDVLPQITSFLPNICPPPSAFLGPKCALWDCPRPAQSWCSKRPVQWWCTIYCSSLHAAIAQNEGQLGMTPVIRPKGIELKDNLLFATLCAKAQGKSVGVPECEGAATAKSPWNAPELFDLSVFEGETLREWLFFDKPRRAFESGNRKQRSLPDYNGRGWHESRKQVINDIGWLKRSYYMDPQPLKFLEWHLYEYEINKYDACALYRLELKLVDRKKSPKGKSNNESLISRQKQLGFGFLGSWTSVSSYKR